MYSGYGIAIDGAGPWSFGNYFIRNVVIFGVNNSSSSHAGDCKKYFLVLDEGPTDYINGSIDTGAKKICINFSKAKYKILLEFTFQS